MMRECVTIIECRNRHEDEVYKHRELGKPLHQLLIPGNTATNKGWKHSQQIRNNLKIPRIRRQAQGLVWGCVPDTGRYFRHGYIYVGAAADHVATQGLHSHDAISVIVQALIKYFPLDLLHFGQIVTRTLSTRIFKISYRTRQ